MAAFLEDPASIAAMLRLESPPLRFQPPPEVANWVHAMPGLWGQDLEDEEWSWLLEVYHRTGAALLREVCRCITEPELRKRATALGRGMELWILTGREEDRESALADLDEIRDRAAPRGLLRVFRGRAGHFVSAINAAAMTLVHPTIHINAGHEQAALFLASRIAPESLRQRLRRELLPWALGRADPLRLRQSGT